MSNIMLEKYTQKSFVLRGDTKPHKDKIAKLGGKWNPYLTDENKEKFGGWIFPQRDQKRISEWLKEIQNGSEIVREDHGPLNGRLPLEDNVPSVDHLEHNRQERHQKLSVTPSIHRNRLSENVSSRHLSLRDIEIERKLLEYRNSIRATVKDSVATEMKKLESQYVWKGWKNISAITIALFVLLLARSILQVMNE